MLVLLVILIGDPGGRLLLRLAGPDRGSSSRAQPRKTKLKDEYLDKKSRRSTSTCTASSCARSSTQFGALLQAAAQQLADGRAAGRHQPGRPRPRPAVRAVQARARRRTTADFYAELPIKIKVTGNYHDMGAFASDVGQLSRIVTLNDVSIDAAQGRHADAWTPSRKTFRYLDDEEIAAQRKAAKRAKTRPAKK